MWLPDVLAVHVCFLEKKKQQNTWWLATKPGSVYVSGALVEVSDLEVIHPPRLTARRMSRLWNAAGRLCGCNELTSKGVHKSRWHASTLTSPRPSVAPTPTPFPFPPFHCCHRTKLQTIRLLSLTSSDHSCFELLHPLTGPQLHKCIHLFV